jgi:hypothetical protein
MRTTDRGTRVPSRLSPRRWASIVGLSAGASVLLIAGVLAIPNSASAAAPPLGSAATYSVLAATAVTNTGDTTTNGDVGVTDAAPDSITGFPPGTAGPPGTLHNDDASAIAAQADLTIAYNTAAAMPTTDSTDLSDISNAVFVAGVYHASSTLQFTGPVFLNGQGDPNSVFVFKVGSALTTADASTVVLENDAQACNVFWQVTSSATLGGANNFSGTIMALTTITVGSGTTIQGRALASTAAVNLHDDTFQQPGCDLTPPPPPTTTPPTTTPPTTTPPTTTPPTTTPPTTTPPTTTPPPPTTTTPVSPVTTPVTPVTPGVTPGSPGSNLTAPIAGLASTGSGGGGSGSGGTGSGPGTSSLVTGSGGSGATSLAFTGSSPWLVPAAYLAGGAAALGALLFLLVGPNSATRRYRKSR